MQNEITELRNQVRRMRIINYSFYTVFALAFLFVWGFLVAGVLHRMEKDIFWNSAMIIDIKDSDGIVRAKKFEVVNDEGITLVDIFSDVAGDGQLRIFDREGKQFARLFLDDEGNGGLGIYNKDSKYEVVGLGVYDGWGVLGVYDKDGEVVARLRAANYGTSENGGGLLKIFNKDIKEVVHIGVDEDGNGVVQTQNGKDEEISVAPSDELCCQHPHHLECIVNTASAPPGSCQHSHHLECGVTNTK